MYMFFSWQLNHSYRRTSARFNFFRMPTEATSNGAALGSRCSNHQHGPISHFIMFHIDLNDVCFPNDLWLEPAETTSFYVVSSCFKDDWLVISFPLCWSTQQFTSSYCMAQVLLPRSTDEGWIATEPRWKPRCFAGGTRTTTDGVLAIAMMVGYQPVWKMLWFVVHV